MSAILFWVLGAILLVMGIYTNWMNWKIFFASKTAKEEFMKNHPDAQIEITAKYRSWLWSLLGIVCLCLACVILYINGTELGFSERLAQSVVYFAIAIYTVALAVEAQTDHKICYTQDGFIFADTYIRYKSIQSVDVGGNFFKSSFIRQTGNKEMAVPKYVAVFAQEHWVEWKTDREQRRKKKNRRG